MNASPFRQFRNLRPVCSVSGDAHHAVRSIRRRIARTEASRGAGSYLYISFERQVYVISEDSSCAQRWVREHFDWLVGFYKLRGDSTKCLSPDSDGIYEDVEAHLMSR